MKKLFVRIGIAALALGIVTSPLFAGGGKEQAGSGSQAVTLTAMVNQTRNTEGLQKMIAKLKAEENITINVQVIPDDQYVNLMQIRFNSGEVPDLIDYNIPSIYYIVDPVQYMVDLTREPWVSNLIMPDNVKYTDGKIYGFPFQSVQGVYGITYNKDVFDKLGLKEPKNWDEFLTLCEQIKTKSGGTIAPIHFPKDAWVPQIWMTENFAKAFTVQQLTDYTKKLAVNQAKWTSEPKMAQVIDHWLSLFSRGYANSDFASASYDNTIESVGTGKAAMHFSGDFFAASVHEAYPDTKLGIFPLSMPTAIEDSITANTASVGFAANKNSKNIDAIKKVFQLWSTPAYANLYFETRFGFPAFKNVNGGDIPDYIVNLNNNYIKTGKVRTEFNDFLGIDKNPVMDYLWVDYINAANRGNITGAQILQNYQPRHEQYMKENRQPGF